MKLGNGLWETSQFDERFQLKQVGLGTTATNNNLFKIDYEYGELNDAGTAVDTSKNIGMIARTTTTIPTTSFVQTFKYDAINRLKEAKEANTNTPTTNNWIQTFDYDRFGNRTNFYQKVGDNVLAINNITKPTIDQSNNQFTTGQGYLYDFNGNLIQDAEGRSFKFNGDDKQIEVKATNNPSQIIGNYYYDASGARIKKVVGNETTVFVYDAGGALAAEYSTATPTTTPTTSYMTTDHLGSPRVITDKNGQVISRRDFMPFGEEIYAGVGGRNTNQKYGTYGSDNIRKRYTGYEKDDETQLDFAEARMYQNKHGRFTAVDPLMASLSPLNPQTFNRYSYVHNNPINDTDPSGLCPTGGCGNRIGPVYTNGTVFSNERLDGYTLYEGGPISVFDSESNTSYIVRVGGWTQIDNISPTPEDTAVVSRDTGTVITTTADEVATTEISSSGVFSPILPIGFVRTLPSAPTLPNPPSFIPTVPRVPEVLPELLPTVTKTSVVTVSTLLGAGLTILLSPMELNPRPPTQTIRPGPPNQDKERREPSDILYRGVRNGGRGYQLALAGVAMPWGFHNDPDEHNEGFTDSIFTSWSRERSVAVWWAKRKGNGGVVLTAKIPKSRQVESLDRSGEGEVLVTGVVFGAGVTRIPK
jgi:RHS repeat-associated protein